MVNTVNQMSEYMEQLDRSILYLIKKESNVKLDLSTSNKLIEDISSFFPLVIAGVHYLNLLSSSKIFNEIGLFDWSV